MHLNRSEKKCLENTTILAISISTTLVTWSHSVALSNDTTAGFLFVDLNNLPKIKGSPYLQLPHHNCHAHSFQPNLPAQW